MGSSYELVILPKVRGRGKCSPILLTWNNCLQAAFHLEHDLCEDLIRSLGETSHPDETSHTAEEPTEIPLNVLRRNFWKIR